ncbi:MAG: addiction module antidote protein [Burkholderiales bacterium]
MTKTVTTPWDPAEHLQSDEDMAAYLEAALEEGDPALVSAALGDIARAKGMTQDQALPAPAAAETPCATRLMRSSTPNSASMA